MRAITFAPFDSVPMGQFEKLTRWQYQRLAIRLRIAGL